MTDKVGAADMGPALASRGAKNNMHNVAPVDFVDSLIAKIWADEVRRVEVSRGLSRRKVPRTTARHTSS